MKLIAILTLLVFSVTSIMETDSSISATEKPRGNVLPLPYGEDVIKKQE